MNEKNKKEFYIYRRRLPHWRMIHSIYFVTWRLRPVQTELLPAERGVIVSALKHFDGQRYELLAYVVMHNHIHVLIRPEENETLYRIVHSWKLYTAHKIQREFGRLNEIWQDEYYDRIVRDDAEFVEKTGYIINNPFKTWPDIKEYEWAWFKEDI